MSAPDTNIEKQEKRHWPSLLGIAAAVLFGSLMGVAITIYALKDSGDSGATAYEGSDVNVEEIAPSEDGAEVAPAAEGEETTTTGD